MVHLRVGPLVRATSATSTVIWTEWSHSCEVILQVIPDEHFNTSEAAGLSLRSHTVTVGERHYAVLQLTGLQPAMWYSYRIVSSTEEGQTLASTRNNTLQCFRTLDPPEAGNPLRLAYGSCRKLSTAAPDALSAFGSWLIQSFDERETTWPRLLLLIGDQIYADDRIGRRKYVPASSKAPPNTFQDAGAQTLAEFARLYEEAWTNDAGTRQVLAALPTYMIFDDHDITNSWNISPTWRAHALESGWEQTLVDGLVAYWIYQGWGNLCNRNVNGHPLLALMQQAAQSGQDVLEALRAYMRQEVYQEISLPWHYEIPTMPPIFVTDVRADRPATLSGINATDAPARIMSREQMEVLQAWMHQHASSTTVLVSSVPVLLPPLIGFAEYLMGLRPFQRTPLRRLGHFIASFQQRIALRTSFDHWPVFSATWHELIKLLSTRSRDIVVLSGDVHFSYAAMARRTFFRPRSHAQLYQLVASPFCNALDRKDRRLILAQALIKRALYGGLYTQMLRLFHAQGTQRVLYDLLLQNTVALVTFQPQPARNKSQGRYSTRQVYLGVKEGTLVEIAYHAID
jgi:phosphodiesterase/alkaline phosphatase D-like protein